jgi:hypothetical protein
MRDAAPDAVNALMAHLVEKIGGPIDTSSGPLSVELTSGAAGAVDGTGLPDLLRQADLAMLAEKRMR